MKLKNVVVGTQIEAKRNTTGECGEPIIKGAVLDVTRVLELSAYDPYRIRVDADYLEDGYTYVDPADFRKVKEVAVEEVPEAPTEQVYKVGDEVLVGAEGAGYGILEPAYAGLVCEVTEVRTNHRGETIVRVRNDSVPTLVNGYSTLTKYISPYIEPVVEPEKMIYNKGDVLLCINDCTGKYGEQCTAGRLYSYVAESKYTGRVRVGDPALYLEEAAVLPENFTLYARKVEDNADTST